MSETQTLRVMRKFLLRKLFCFLLTNKTKIFRDFGRKVNSKVLPGNQRKINKQTNKQAYSLNPSDFSDPE